MPVSLAAGMAAYNHIAQQPLQGFEQASLLAGFLSYKVHMLAKHPSTSAASPDVGFCEVMHLLC